MMRFRILLAIPALLALVLATNPASADHERGEIPFAPVRAPVFGTPDVVGLDLTEAEQILLDEGFVPVLRFVHARGAAPWTVLQQDDLLQHLGGFDRVEGDRNEPLDRHEPFGRNDPLDRDGPGFEHRDRAFARVRLDVARPEPLRHGLRMLSVYGLGAGEAARLLAELGVRATVREVRAEFRPGMVFRQVPEAGVRLRPGAAVEVTVAARHGRPAVPVLAPAVAGLTLPEIRRVARGMGLDVRAVSVRAPGHALDHAVAQTPRPGERAALGSVLEVAFPLAAEVPALRGLAVEQAVRLAARHDLGVQVADAFGRRGTGRVVAQNPAPGTLVAAGTEVRVRLDREVHVPLALVPDVVGLPVAAAVRRLEAAGLVATVMGSLADRGAEVTWQSASAGARLPRGTVVRLAAARGHAGIRAGVRIG
jgi:beta-lactam-binding protein with PASTA domain